MKTGKKIKIFAPTKINLCLDILKKHSSGFHEIQTVFQQIDGLCDEIEIKEIPKTALLKSANSLAHRAAELLQKKFKIKKSITIKIKKNIPRSSGLGSESSCAAAVLKALNKLWNLKLSTKKLTKIASQVGMDVPFFIVGGTALGTHFGEKITPLKPIKNIHFTVFASSSRDRQKTKNAYAKLNLKKCGLQKSQTKKLLTAIKNSKKISSKKITKIIVENIHNDFETLTPTKPGHHLSGSGPSTFTVKI